MSVFAKICRRLLHPVVGELWCLHRVLPIRSWAPSNRELEITPEYLEQLIVGKQNEGYQFVHIDQIVDQKYALTHKRQINITFDDGFKDVYQYAFPIFKKYNIPFTIYLTTDFPDGTANLWWILLEKIVKENTSLEFGGKHFNCATEGEKIDTFEAVIQEIYQQEETPIEVLSDCLQKYAAGIVSTDDVALSWGELQEMLDSGLLTIGSHSVTHPMLTKITLDKVEQELVASKKRIEEQLGVEVKHFSYPHSAYNEQMFGVLKQCGYISASLGYGGNIRYGADKMMLNRNYIVQK